MQQWHHLFHPKKLHPTNLWPTVKKLDRTLDRHWGLLAILLLVLALRVPNLFEPYWYGDEGIYLTIGTALNYGRELYAGIVDHKTPLIYFFARLSDQVPFRLLLTGWMLTSTALFYAFSYRLLKARLAAGSGTLAFALFTTLPWFEGNIPNGELFVIGFILLGAVLLMPTGYLAHFLKGGKQVPKQLNVGWLFAAGVVFGLGILTKVPALFDLVAFLAIGFLTVTNQLSLTPASGKRLQKLVRHVGTQMGIILGGALTALLLSVGYFLLRGTLGDYLNFGLLYNFHYAGNWQLPFDHQLLLLLFSLPGKFVVATLIVLGAAWLRKFLRPVQQLGLAWFALTLFASLLSNRPYPHYFLQVIPPLALLLGSAVREIVVHWQTAGQSRTADPAQLSLSLVSTGGALGLFIAVLLLLNVGLYPVQSYYTHWWQLITGQISKTTYRNQFNHLMADNYRAAPILRTAENRTIFIWGTNPMLYALSDTIPADKFTVAFHIADLDAYDQTLAAVRQEQPEYIVLMNEDRHTFPQLTQYMMRHYYENSQFDHFTIWRYRNGLMN